MEDIWEKIIQETHDWVDTQRVLKGKKPYHWPKLNRRERVAQRIVDGVTINGQPLKVFLEEEARSEVDSVLKSEVREKSSGINYPPKSKYENISGARSERKDYANNPQISEEVVVQLNFIAHYKGEKAVTEYLNQNPDRTTGPVEAALKDAREKILLLKREQTRIQADLIRYEAVEKQLQDTVNILTGKVTLSPGQPDRERKVRGDRIGQLKELLKDGPQPRNEIFNKLAAQGCTRGAAYQCVLAQTKRGTIEQKEGYLTWIGA